MKNIVITDEAENDLLAIAEYTQQQWGLAQRERYIESLFECMQWLLVNHKLAKPRDEIKEGYFSYPEGKHHIFFKVENDDLVILAVLHEMMDFDRHL